MEEGAEEVADGGRALVHHYQSCGGVGELQVDDGGGGAVEGGFPPGVKDDGVRGPFKAGGSDLQ